MAEASNRPVERGSKSTSGPGIPTVESKLQEACKLKLQGNDCYKSGDLKKALGKYHRALLYLKGIGSDLQGNKNPFTGALSPNSPSAEVDSVTQSLIDQTTVSVYNNLAAVLLASPSCDAAKVKDYVDLALELDPRNEKAWHRRGVALLRLEKFSDAFDSLSKSVELSPSGHPDAKTREMIRQCEANMTKDRKVEADMCRKMFS